MHDVIKGMDAENWVSCEDLANKHNKSKATIYTIICNYKKYLESKREGRIVYYRRKNQVDPQFPTVGNSVESVPEASAIQAPVIVTTPQVLSHRVTDITLKTSFLKRVREKLNHEDKRYMDVILADLEMIKACS